MADNPARGPEGPGGSSVNMQHTERDVTLYVLMESELDRLGDLNTTAAAFTGLGSFFGGLWLDLYKDESLAASLPLATEQALQFIQPLLLLLTLAFTGLAVYFWVQRGRYKSRIKRDSRTKSTVRGEVRTSIEGDDGGRTA